ncbi:MAG: LytTR family transcriptional regulator DNA-binding domain-containing protein [Saprospiraceae bacterium]|nr:LytTR family transcriptional regulator DNA-binding domain-containing protein [Saprospiraceae bacterium]
MDHQIDIMVVEDDMIIAADISMQLTQLGYNVSAILPKGEDALAQLQHSQPDIILMDVGLKGDLDGVDTAQEILNNYEIPVIFLTANSDPETFRRAKHTRPFAFITKPFEAIDLERSLELLVSRLTTEKEETSNAEIQTTDQGSYILSDRIFIRFKERMVKVFLNDIKYIEAERAYCRVHTTDKEYLITLPLKAFSEKLAADQFLRVHRSYMVNLSKVDELAEEYVVIGKKMIPVSKNYREEVARRLRTI